MKLLHSISKRSIIISLIVLVALAATYITVFVSRSHADTKESIKPKVGAEVPSDFKFTGTDNWWQGATRKSDMALFHKLPDSCFVSVQHKTGTIADDIAKLQKNEAKLIADGHTITPIATRTLTMQTSAGPQEYQLHQSSLVTPEGSSKLLGGQEFGHLQISSGYIYIMGYCETPEQLEATIPALQAVTFEGSI